MLKALYQLFRFIRYLILCDIRICDIGITVYKKMMLSTVINNLYIMTFVINLPIFGRILNYFVIVFICTA